jgi:hypothetical protein
MSLVRGRRGIKEQTEGSSVDMVLGASQVMLTVQTGEMASRGNVLNAPASFALNRRMDSNSLASYIHRGLKICCKSSFRRGRIDLKESERGHFPPSFCSPCSEDSLLAGLARRSSSTWRDNEPYQNSH